MTWRLNLPVKLNSAAFLLFASGSIGFILGWCNATWQDSVETGQVIAGLVLFPPFAPSFLYHQHAYSFINQFTALLLILFKSEILVSKILSALLGMLSFQALATIIFALNRNMLLSFLGCLFIYFFRLWGDGVVYPIELLGSPHTYGVAALSFIVLTCGLIGCGSFRLGLFCLGAAVSVHVTLGLFLLGVMFLTFFFQYKSVKDVLKEYYRFLFLGFAFSAASIGVHYYWMHLFPALPDKDAGNYMQSYITYWDFHRQKFYWNYATGHWQFLKPGVILCLWSMAVAAMGIRMFAQDKSRRFLFWAVFVAGVLSLLSAALTHLPPIGPIRMLLLGMPGRLINFNIFVCTALFFGILTSEPLQKHKTNFLVYLLFLFTTFIPRPMIKMACLFLLSIVWFSLSLVKGEMASFRGKILAWLGAHDLLWKQTKTVLYATVLCAAITLLLVLQPTRRITISPPLQDRTNNATWGAISKRAKLLLVSTDFWLVPVLTRIPILIDPAALDAIPMVPESNRWNDVLKKVYGVDLTVPPPIPFRNQGVVASERYKGLWEKRSVAEWQSLKKEYGVSHVLTKRDWRLSLPLAFEAKHISLYSIP